MITIDDVADANALHRAVRKSMKGVTWKASVQRYEINMLRNILELEENNRIRREPGAWVSRIYAK